MPPALTLGSSQRKPFQGNGSKQLSAQQPLMMHQPCDHLDDVCSAAAQGCEFTCQSSGKVASGGCCDTVFLPHVEHTNIFGLSQVWGLSHVWLQTVNLFGSTTSFGLTAVSDLACQPSYACTAQQL